MDVKIKGIFVLFFAILGTIDSMIWINMSTIPIDGSNSIILHNLKVHKNESNSEINISIEIQNGNVYKCDYLLILLFSNRTSDEGVQVIHFLSINGNVKKTFNTNYEILFNINYICISILSSGSGDYMEFNNYV